MGLSKYAADYRLENVMDKNGKLVTKPVYRGDLFDFKVEGEARKRVKVVFGWSTLVAVLAVFSCLFFNTGCLRALYVALPLLGTMFPLLGQVDAVLALLFTRAPYERVKKDRISQKLVSYTFVSMFLSLCSAVGHLVFWMTAGETLGDMAVLALTLMVFALSLNLFLSRSTLEMEKVGSTRLDG